MTKKYSTAMCYLPPRYRAPYSELIKDIHEIFSILSIFSLWQNKYMQCPFATNSVKKFLTPSLKVAFAKSQGRQIVPTTYSFTQF